MDIRNAVADITSTEDLLERALKLSGLVSTFSSDKRLRKAFGGKRVPDLRVSRDPEASQPGG